MSSEDILPPKASSYYGPVILFVSGAVPLSASGLDIKGYAWLAPVFTGGNVS